MTETTSNKPQLGLPRDIAHKIFALLKPKSRPECVLCFHDHHLYFKEGSLTEEEMNEFTQEEGYISFVNNKSSSYIGSFDSSGRVALFQGFRFKDEASRARWKNDEDFEMYRDAIYSIDT